MRADVGRVQQLAVPCDLKLTMFIGGGVEDGAQAPHLSFVPIPLLSKVNRRRHDHILYMLVPFSSIIYSNTVYLRPRSDSCARAACADSEAAASQSRSEHLPLQF
jgi:hypothetical protein